MNQWTICLYLVISFGLMAATCERKALESESLEAKPNQNRRARPNHETEKEQQPMEIPNYAPEEG